MLFNINAKLATHYQAIDELSAEKLKEYREIFSFFDRDGGGSIGADEFEQVMRTFGWEPKEEELKVGEDMLELYLVYFVL